LKSGPPIEPFHDPPRGTVLSEGAGAIVLARKGAIGVSEIHRGAVFTRRQDAGKIVAEIIRDLVTAADTIIIASANGTFIDLAEQNAIRDKIPSAIVYAPKAAMGESVGASALWQTIIGAQALRTRRLPASVRLVAAVSAETESPTQSANVIVLSCSLNQQASGLRLSIE
jgi:3-oxoacyl-(acyl-carrier-protein) synthase